MGIQGIGKTTIFNIFKNNE